MYKPLTLWIEHNVHTGSKKPFEVRCHLEGHPVYTIISCATRAAAEKSMSKRAKDAAPHYESVTIKA